MQRQVSESDAGLRLDVWLAREFGLSRGYVRRLLSHDSVRVNGAPAVKGTLLRSSDRIEVEPFRHPEQGPIASADPDLVILGEADGLVAVDKPAGRATQPLDYEETGTVLNALLARYPELSGVGEGGLMSGVVHRLDRDTSGVLLFARTDAAWQRARSAFDERRVEKTYHALVHGRLEGEQQISIELDHRGDRMRVVASGGRTALTQLRAVEIRGDTTLVEARPVTGLMHQLRVSLSELGHPIVGDALYGSTRDEPRHWLHASRIVVDGFVACSEPPPILRPAS